MYLNENYEEFETNNIILSIYSLFILLLIYIFQKKSSFFNAKENDLSFQIYKESQIIPMEVVDSIPSINLNKIDKLYIHYIDKYLNSIPSKYETEKSFERAQLTNFFSLKNLSNNNSLNKESMEKISEKYKIDYKKNFSELENLFIKNPIAFGNTIICLNNVIFYCEILGCKNIFLNSEYNWYIKNKIISDNLTISLMTSSQINCESSNTLCMSFEGGMCLNPYFIKQRIRINVLKDEILRNLPKVKTHSSDLYIHIRSGDIFSNSINPSYSQPPFCFYQEVLYQFKFRKIYIISFNKKNPVIEKLLKENKNIIYKKNLLEKDIAYLSKAYNLVGSVSSLLLAAIKLNNNLKNYWEYDNYRLSAKYFHLHHDIYEFPRNFSIYKMKPSENYKNEMFSWENDKNQLKLMVQEKCYHNFSLLK